MAYDLAERLVRTHPFSANGPSRASTESAGAGLSTSTNVFHAQASGRIIERIGDQ